MSKASLAKKLAWRLRKFLLARPSTEQRLSGPLVVAGFFSTASGVGQWARGCAAGLSRQGFAPICVDVSGYFRQRDFDSGLVLSTMPQARCGTLILHANAPETERALFELGLWRTRDWRVIGCWAWELAQTPNAWRPAARFVSELWAPSAFAAEAFRKALNIPVKVVPPYVEIPASQQYFSGDGESGVRCLAIADGRSSFPRKNILGAVAVFKDAAGARGDCALTIKTRNLNEFPHFASDLRQAIDNDPRICLIDGPLSAEDQRVLMAECDVVISLHRCEGFGLVVAEAMAMGKAVIATDWSGNVDFMDASCAMPIPARLVPVEDPTGIYRESEGAIWAEPDLTTAAASLRELLNDPDLRRRLGGEARARIASRLDGSAYSRALEGVEIAS